MKVLLTTINSKYIHQNLAIRLLFHLNKNFQDLYLNEFIRKEHSDAIASYCTDYDIVAFSCYIWNISKTLEVSRQIKTRNPHCKILLGGPEVSFEWDDIINRDEIDFIITGEGEIPFSSFLNNYPEMMNVPGLIWKNEGQVIQNENNTFFDLDQLNGINPYGNDSKEELENKVCYIESSRGCPHTCDFCLAGIDNKLRYLPFEQVKENLKFLMQRGKTIKFLDRTFNANPRFAISIFRYILENHKPGQVFQFEIKADVVQDELIDFVRNEVPKGLFRFEIGIQTLNQKSNAAIHRKENFERVKHFIEQVSDKIEIHLDLIVGLPYDYFQDIRYSFNKVFALFAPELQLGFLKFLKGTPIRKNVRQHGYIFDNDAPYQIIESNYLKKEELIEIDNLEEALEIYWNKKRAIHTLKYIASNYSIFDFLLGLGSYLKNLWKEKTGDVASVFECIREFSEVYFVDNELIKTMIALDYYLYYKVQPKTRFLPEVNTEVKLGLYEKLRLDQHKYRYSIHQTGFNLSKYLNLNILEQTTDFLIVRYDGVNKAEIVWNLP